MQYIIHIYFAEIRFTKSNAVHLSKAKKITILDAVDKAHVMKK